jgi:hypothetical protein
MIEISTSQIKEVENRLGAFRSKAPSVISSAINRAAQNAKTNATRKAREEYQVKAKDINETIKIRKATRKSLGAEVKSTGYRTPLIKFKVSPAQPRPKNPPKVLKAAVKKDGLKSVLGAFVSNINGNKVFRRTTKSRLPIEQLFGPAVPQMLGNKDVRSFIESEAAKTLDKRIDHEINRVLEGAK